jgi:hypothetical protein
MRKILFGVIITLLLLFGFKYCTGSKDTIVLNKSSSLIQE